MKLLTSAQMEHATKIRYQNLQFSTNFLTFQQVGTFSLVRYCLMQYMRVESQSWMLILCLELWRQKLLMNGSNKEIREHSFLKEVHMLELVNSGLHGLVTIKQHK